MEKLFENENQTIIIEKSTMKLIKTKREEKNYLILKIDDKNATTNTITKEFIKDIFQVKKKIKKKKVLTEIEKETEKSEALIMMSLKKDFMLGANIYMLEDLKTEEGIYK
jgi:hypothetical protein